jgi:GNAT superfamily N-acetyltransferase
MIVLAPFSLRRAGTLEQVPAQLIELTPAFALSKVDALWWRHPDLNISSRESEGDEHWKWQIIAQDYARDPLRGACVAPLSVEDYLEGALAYRFDAKSRLEPGRGCVYIGWLATAPRNRKWICSRPAFVGVGSDLVLHAVRESYLFGLGGRVFLQSLPIPQTRAFYEGKGFVRTDESQPQGGLIDYELPTAAAQMWLHESEEE